MTPTIEPWGDVALHAGDETTQRLGELTLRLRRTRDEVWFHGTHGDPDDAEPEEWNRWALEPDEHVALRPRLPDRLVVVSTEQPFHLPPHGRARVYLRIPLFVALVRAGWETETTLTQFPTMVLSDTWWGTFTAGELGYWITTKARREVSDDLFDPSLAVCAVDLTNEAGEPLAVERFAVRVAHLTLFARGNQVWTDEVRVRYEGAPEGSEIRYTGQAPDRAGTVDKLAPPREPPPRGLTALTFGRLRAISGWA